MAKSKSAGSIPNRPLYSRMSYLYQAAVYLRSQAGNNVPDKLQNGPATEIGGTQDEHRKTSTLSEDKKSKDTLSRHLLTDLRAASLKGQIRLSPAIKSTICKFCDTLLVEGETSTSIVENKSKGGKKPWADVLVIKCSTCGGEKRFPVQAPRQKRRPLRESKPSEVPQDPKENAKPTHQNDLVMMGP
ncbi:Rpr2-domain-containing protein [Xylariaceae sp. FL0255]|nr:Rpr2-domain-containing protein [Xylariaceae sp. FL0255]